MSKKSEHNQLYYSLIREKGKVDEKEMKKEEEVLKPKVCPRCNKVNEATAKYCNCGMALDLKTIMKDKEKVDEEISKTNSF